MYAQILVPLDGSKLAECVLPHVEAIASGCRVQNVIFLQVVEPFYIPVSAEGAVYLTDKDVRRIEVENRAVAENYLKKLVSETKYDGVNIKSEIIIGIAAESISDYATKNAVDLIAIATHGRSGVSRWVMGSVADRVLHSACVPILMIRAPGCVPGI